MCWICWKPPFSGQFCSSAILNYDNLFFAVSTQFVASLAVFYLKIQFWHLMTALRNRCGSISTVSLIVLIGSVHKSWNTELQFWEHAEPIWGWLFWQLCFINLQEIWIFRHYEKLDLPTSPISKVTPPNVHSHYNLFVCNCFPFIRLSYYLEKRKKKFCGEFLGLSFAKAVLLNVTMVFFFITNCFIFRLSSSPAWNRIFRIFTSTCISFLSSKVLLEILILLDCIHYKLLLKLF